MLNRSNWSGMDGRWTTIFVWSMSKTLSLFAVLWHCVNSLIFMAFYYCGLPIVKSHKIERLLATWNANTRYSYKKKTSELHFPMAMLNDHFSWKIFDLFLIRFKTISSTSNGMLCDRIFCFYRLDFSFLNISTNDIYRTISSTVLFTLDVSTLNVFDYEIKMRNKRIELRVMDNVASERL